MPDPSTVLPIELLQKIFKHYLLDWPNADVAAPLFNNPLKQQPLFENRQTQVRYLTPGPVQSLDLSYGLWVLGKVNRAWRNATLSSETLWSTVRITFSSQPQWFQDLVWDRAIRKISFSPDSNIPSKILTEILSRSGSAPLSITLSLPVEMPREEILADAVSRSLFVLLSEQSHRWQWMELTVPTMIWEDFVQISPSRLETLRRLHATVQGGPFLFQIIGVCTSVVDLKISVTHWKSHTALPPIPIMMPFLQYLDIGSSQCDVLKAITAPSLKSLRLQTRGYQSGMPSFCSGFVDFIQRSSCSNSVVALDLSGGTCSCREVIEILSRTPSGDTSSPSLLPNLGTLLFDGMLALGRADLDLFLDMVEFRIAGRLRNVRIGHVFGADIENLKGRLSYLNSLPGVAIEFDEVPDRGF
ncbi:hypothetical protein IW261DRAFT_1572189 [Armillaria novae-zelandiae]|uniref:F-box domain-containing protein n=1 Tax=Armillaria novae-zelandiae TaxID=153914 RepID=A0AA39NTD1_9AGAR|nr:hypothetical protein IW261DRAFT_1572189 [Armillaria novae-zelandiae]